MFSRLERLYLRIRDRVRKLPKPIYLIIFYVVLYFTGIREVTGLLESWLKVSDSMVELIKRGALVVFASHWLLVTGVLIVSKYWRKLHVKSIRRLLSATLLVAVGIGAIATVPTLILRGPVTVVDDKERITIANQIIPEFEANVSNAVSGSFGQANGRLQSLREILMDQDGKYHDLRGFFHDYQEQRRANPIQKYGYLVVYLPSNRPPGEAPMTAPDFSSEVPKKLVEHLRLGIKTCPNQGNVSVTQWLTWTPFGHLAAAACRDPRLGTLIVATLWDEGSFLASTRRLWDTKGFGLSLVQSSNHITYTTEISDYGDRRRGESVENVETRHITEVWYRKHVHYVYQAPARNQDLFPDLSLRLRFPDTPRPTLMQIVKSVLVLVLGLTIVAGIVGKDVIVEVDEPARASPLDGAAPSG